MDLSTCEQVPRPVNSKGKVGYVAGEHPDLQLVPLFWRRGGSPNLAVTFLTKEATRKLRTLTCLSLLLHPVSVLCLWQNNFLDNKTVIGSILDFFK